MLYRLIYLITSNKKATVLQREISRRAGLVLSRLSQLTIPQTNLHQIISINRLRTLRQEQLLLLKAVEQLHVKNIKEHVVK